MAATAAAAASSGGSDSGEQRQRRARSWGNNEKVPRAGGGANGSLLREGAWAGRQQALEPTAVVAIYRKGAARRHATRRHAARRCQAWIPLIECHALSAVRSLHVIERVG